MKQLGPLYQNTQHLKTNNVMAVESPSVPPTSGVRQADVTTSPTASNKSTASPKQKRGTQMTKDASPKSVLKTTQLSTAKNVETENPAKTGSSPKASASSHNLAMTSAASPRVKVAKSGSYDFVSRQQPDIINELSLERETTAAAAGDRDTYEYELNAADVSDAGSLSESEPVLLKEHRKLPGEENFISADPRHDARYSAARAQSAANLSQMSHDTRRSQFAEASKMLMNTCPDLQRPLQEEYCTDETLLFPFSPSYRHGGGAHAHAHEQTTQRLMSSVSKKPGSSAERIRKIIPEQASLFNEKVKPELNRILNERNVKRDSIK